jgi:hypothetical protein
MEEAGERFVSSYPLFLGISAPRVKRVRKG